MRFRVPRIRIIESMLVLSVLAMTVLGVIILSPNFLPAPLKFTSFQVVDYPPAVIATGHRKDIRGCTNGPQADLMDSRGEITRLPVPARSISGSTSIYPLVIPEGMARGRYAVLIRESFLCAGRDPRIIESPWLPLEVK